MESEKYKLTLDEMLALSRRIPNRNWAKASVTIPEDLFSETTGIDRYIPENAVMYRGSHPNGINIEILVTPLTRGAHEDIALIYVDYEDIEIGAHKGRLPFGPTLEFSKIKERYREIVNLFSNEAKRKEGYYLAMKVLRSTRGGGAI